MPVHDPFVPHWHKRHLPHFEGGNIPQGVTFRLIDALPRQQLSQIDEHLTQLDQKISKTERIRLINSLLDVGHGAAWLNNEAVAKMVQQSLLFFNGHRYHMHAWVIMPNHVHALFTPAYDWTLTKILHTWKSYSAREANKILNRTGPFWQVEYFDRAMRNEAEFLAAISYIENNPVKAGLCATTHEWKFGSAFPTGS